MTWTLQTSDFRIVFDEKGNRSYWGHADNHSCTPETLFIEREWDAANFSKEMNKFTAVWSLYSQQAAESTHAGVFAFMHTRMSAAILAPSDAAKCVIYPSDTTTICFLVVLPEERFAAIHPLIDAAATQRTLTLIIGTRFRYFRDEPASFEDWAKYKLPTREQFFSKELFGTDAASKVPYVSHDVTFVFAPKAD